MDLIPLSAVPNQSVAFNVDGAYWQVRLFQAVDQVYADITRNGDVLITGTRCFGGVGVLPYEDLYAPDFGNFIFDNDVDWTQFGVSCRLYYLDAAELKQYNQLVAAVA